MATASGFEAVTTLRDATPPGHRGCCRRSRDRVAAESRLPLYLLHSAAANKVRYPQQKMENINLGLVGCGTMGQLVHLPILLEQPGCEVVALAEVRRKLGDRVAAKHGIRRRYLSHRNLAADPEVEAVVVVVGDDLHAPIALDLLAAQKHVLVEKPLATNVVDAERMVQAAASAGVVLTVNFTKRLDPGVELARQIIEDVRRTGELGEIELVRTHRFGNDWFCDAGEPIITDEPHPDVARSAPAWLPEDFQNHFRHVNNLYCHSVDLLDYLVEEVTSVDFAYVRTSKELELDPAFGRGWTAPTGALGLSSDAPVYFLAVLRLGQLRGIVSGGARAGEFWDEETVVYFSRGWVNIKTPPPLLRDTAARVEVCRGDGRREVFTPSGVGHWAFQRLHEYFLDSVANGSEPRSSGQEALRNLKIMESIFQKHLELHGSGA